MAEKIVQVTYARVAKGATPKQAESRHHDAALDTFLLAHARELRGFAKGKNSCPATFTEAEGKVLFETLRTGNEDDFLQAAHKLTLRLVGQMNGATADGLLVCIQISDNTTSPATSSAAVLKLQVVTPNAANLETLDSGEVLLSAVTDVMDAPGKLQKGALVADDRADSDVIMGDVASKEAQYFPTAFGISIDQRPSLAAADILTVIKELHGEPAETAARNQFPNIQPGPVSQVLEELSESVTELEPEPARQAVHDRLNNRPRPVRRIDTTAPLTEVISADSITIKLPVTGTDRVTWEPDTNHGGFIITIRVDEEPRRNYV